MIVFRQILENFRCFFKKRAINVAASLLWTETANATFVIRSIPPNSVKESVTFQKQILNKRPLLKNNMAGFHIVGNYQTIFKPEHQKPFRAIPERFCEVFPKKKKQKN